MGRSIGVVFASARAQTSSTKLKWFPWAEGLMFCDGVRQITFKD